MKRSKHSLSHWNLMTCDMGGLYPCATFEGLPGDTIDVRSSALIRVSPLVAPVMHPVVVRLHWWEVPHRQVWSGFEAFITGGPDGNDNSQVPTNSLSRNAKDLLDYMGCPVAATGVNALPVRSFNRVYNEFYRDQDLVAERGENDISVPNIAWEKDIFCGSRPWPQKGPDVTLPLGTQAPIKTDGTSGQSLGYQAPNVGSGNYAIETNTSTGNISGQAAQAPMYADLSSATALNVNDLRTAFALQRWQEARARYGSRYVEYLRYLGVKSSDLRLQRPRYLGGGKATITFSEVLQTVDDETGANRGPLGRMGGHGIAAVRTRPFRVFLEEHCTVLCLMSVRPKAMYTDATSRMWWRRNREDYFQRELAHVGQQVIQNREVYAGHSTPGGAFGYKDRYAEYKQEFSKVSGEFRTDLDYWHMARKFTSDVALNESFIRCVPTKRIHAVQTHDILWNMIHHRIRARRMVPKAGFSTVR